MISRASGKAKNLQKKDLDPGATKLRNWNQEHYKTMFNIYVQESENRVSENQDWSQRLINILNIKSIYWKQERENASIFNSTKRNQSMS